MKTSAGISRLIFFPLLVTLFLCSTSCSPKLEEEVVLTWPDNTPQKVNFYQPTGEKRMKVREVKYYESGKKEMEGEFENGRKSGKWTSWFENGQKQSEGFFKEDLRDGKALVYRENGFTYYEGYYSMGRPHGTWIFYDPNGKRIKEAHYEYGVKIKEMDYSTAGE